VVDEYLERSQFVRVKQDIEESKLFQTPGGQYNTPELSKN